MVSQHRNAPPRPGTDQVPSITAANASAEEHILDAAYELMVTIGMRKTTMADIARKAGVSRATLYRRWGGVNQIVAALMTREWARLGTDALHTGADHVRSALVAEVVRLVRDARGHPLLRTIVELEPEFLLPYLLQRRGKSTDHQLATLELAIAAGVADGSIADGDVGAQAKTVLLTAWSFVFTGPVFAAGDATELAAVDEQLRLLLERYLRP